MSRDGLGEILSRAKSYRDHMWVEGYYVPPCIISHGARIFDKDGELVDVEASTFGVSTGLRDKHETLIFTGDITQIVLTDGETRNFVVDIKTVTRTVVSHPDFDDETAKVAITGVVFSWGGYDLFPCIDENGTADSKKMEVVGNIHDTPELLTTHQPEAHANRGGGFGG